MEYLGEQLEAKNLFFKRANCWLNIKFSGKYSKSNLTGYICGIENCSTCSQNPKKSKDFSPFANFFLPYLEEIITSAPNELLDIEARLRQQWVSEGKGDAQDFKNTCSLLFKKRGYKEWFTKHSINYELSEWLNRHTCTYCNRQYIFTARKVLGGKGLICQFDHWFDKGSHPLLSLSFYNLIPSCSVCNSSAMKGSKYFTTDTHLHPYLDKNVVENYRFTYRKKSFSENEITIESLDLKNLKIQKTINDLNLNLSYKNHSSKELQDLIDLRKKYSGNYLKILLEHTFKHGLSITEEEKYRLIFGIEISDSKKHTRIFSRFKHDIILELLSIEN